MFLLDSSIYLVVKLGQVYQHKHTVKLVALLDEGVRHRFIHEHTDLPGRYHGKIRLNRMTNEVDRQVFLLILMLAGI